MLRNPQMQANQVIPSGLSRMLYWVVNLLGG
jgi:hypothetical protein